MTSCPDLRWISVPAVDDFERPEYPRPDVLEISAAHTELKRLDRAGELLEEQAPPVRVLLAAVGRLSAGGMAEAFPPPPRPGRRLVVDALEPGCDR